MTDRMGKVYRDFRGYHYKVVGRTSVDNCTVWTLQGGALNGSEFSGAPVFSARSDEVIADSFEEADLLAIGVGDILRDQDGTLYLAQSATLLWRLPTDGAHSTYGTVEYWLTTRGANLEQVTTISGATMGTIVKVK